MVETSGSPLLDFVRSQVGTGVVGLSFSNEALKKRVMGEFGLVVYVSGKEEEALKKAKEVAKRLRERGFHAAVEVGSMPGVHFFAPPGNPSSRQHRQLAEAIYAHMQEHGRKPGDHWWVYPEHNPTIPGSWGAKQWEHVAFIRKVSQREKRE